MKKIQKTNQNMYIKLPLPSILIKIINILIKIYPQIKAFVLKYRSILILLTLIIPISFFIKNIYNKDQRISKSVKIKVRQVDPMPEPAMNLNFFKASKEQKLKEIYEVLKQIKKLESVQYRYTVLKDEEPNRLTEVETQVIMSGNFKDLVGIIELIRPIAYQISYMNVSHIGDSDSDLIISITFKSLYKEKSNIKKAT